MWDGLQDAMFRNVPFYVDEITGKSGRRAIAHDYPKREDGSTEDNGAAMWQFSIQAVLVGVNYRQELNALLNALNAYGPGKLVHPHFGEMLVQVGEVSHKLSGQKGGYASVSFECYKADRMTLTTAEDATEDVLADSVETGLTQVSDDFENGFFTELLPDFSLEELTQQVTGYIDDMTEFVRQLPDVAGMMSDVMDAVEKVKYSIGSLLAAPGELVRDITNVLKRAEDLVTTPPEALKVYDQLIRRYEGKAAEIKARRAMRPSPVPDTVLAIQEKCETQLSLMMLAQVSLLSAGTVPRTEFTDVKLAQETAERIDARLQSAGREALSLGQRDSWQALRLCSVALRTDINQRALLLPQVRTLTTRRTEPLILLAYRETGNARNRDSMLIRNRLKHPGFVMPGQTLEWINE